MEPSLLDILASYNDSLPLDQAWTIPGSWYTDERIAGLERQAVFAQTWQVVGRTDQVEKAGQYVTAEVAGEPVVVVRGNDQRLRAFFNVCRHHAAAVVTEPEGCASLLRCPYHGWTYSLEGALKGIPEFDGVSGYDRSANGLVPIHVDTWEKFVFVNLHSDPAPLGEFLGGLVERARPLDLSSLNFVARRSYTLNCNWKVFVDNYLDGGYHVPHLHKGLNSVLDYVHYRIENIDRCCVQSSPMKPSDVADSATAAARKGDYAYYLWQYPNFMINWYEGYMDTNLVQPLAIDRCLVVFDFYFADISEANQDYIRQSIEISDRVQGEDLGICESVQKGLSSRAYKAGRLSVRREAGEHLFHRLLASDLKNAVGSSASAK
ncbi:MAG TPA: aromatic ring-hydroxylating dioxygenase subunit alpha [Terriglobales bacterium]|jgi:choline monooxygenase|nr:aromatic ring-hydroxylating dioxygenase subunit alpha [Terriglobales bacterium]